MVFKRQKALIAPLLCALFLAADITPVWGQGVSYHIEMRFVQRLSWAEDEYALNYLVLIDRQYGHEFRRFFQSFTVDAFIDVSLPAGNYRMQVIPHDFFGQPVPVDEWLYFEVRSGDERFDDGEQEIIIVHYGDEAGRAAVILTVPEAEIVIEYQNVFDIYLGMLWIPLLPIHGENVFFGEDFSLLGVAGRAAVVSARPSFLNFGLELLVSWRSYEITAGEGDLQSLAFDFNALAQIPLLPGRMFFKFRLGAGVSLLAHDGSAASVGQYSIHANSGLSFLWMAWRNLYLELGILYSQFFTSDYFGFFRPWVGLGWRF